MNTCRHCGAQLTEDAKYCGICGAEQTTSTDEKETVLCDCCRSPIRKPQVPQIRSINNVRFQLCKECSNHIDNLYQRPFMSEKERKAEETWAKQKLENGTVVQEKKETFAQLLKSFYQYSYINNPSAEEGIHVYGSPWTIIAKMVCFFWVIAAMFGGGVLGKYLTGEDGSIFWGGLIGLIVGLVMVSGVMILIQIADDVADSRLYLKKIYNRLNSFEDKHND